MISAPKTYPPRLLPLRLPRVCVAVAAADPAELVEKAEALIRDNSFLEFRLDYISKPALALPKIKHFLETHPGTVVIATCRRAPAEASSAAPLPPNSTFSPKPRQSAANWLTWNCKPH